MMHFVCKGTCKGFSDLPVVCEMDGCPNQWQLLEECACTDGLHFRQEAAVVLIVKDSNGTVLHDGDDVVLIKDLPLRGSSKTLKRGTKTKIKLTDNPDEVDCKLAGMGIVLRAEFLKKV